MKANTDTMMHEEIATCRPDPQSAMRNSQSSGVGLIEVMFATFILVVVSLSVLGLVSLSIASNNRNRMDSTGTMLAQSVVEQVKATIIGSGSSSLTDCDGTEWVINTEPGGVALSGGRVDFAETSPPDEYHMDYVVKSPCDSTGTFIDTYDVRWRVEIVGDAAGTPTNTYEIYLAARKQGHSEGNMLFALPVNFRVMAGN